MRYWLIFFIMFVSKTLFAEDNNELQDFVDKYLNTFEDKLSYKSFKMVIDVDDSEIIINKKYGTFKYKFQEYQIGEGEMVIEKDYNNMSFQLLNNAGNPLFSLNYKILFD